MWLLFLKTNVREKISDENDISKINDVDIYYTIGESQSPFNEALDTIVEMSNVSEGL